MINRRNYYRLLQVQPDAATEVIRASYRTLMQKLRFHPDLGGDEWNATLINEAYAVLSDPVRRARYDAARKEEGLGLGPGGHSLGAATMRRSPATTARRARDAFESLTCPLCNTVNNVSSQLPDSRRCRSCQSPLTRVDSVIAETPRARAVPRLERRIPLRYVLASARTRAGHGVATDLSSQGMRFITRPTLPVDELLRLECELLSAVARIVTCREATDGSGGHVVGVAFITAEFANSKGSLVEYQA